MAASRLLFEDLESVILPELLTQDAFQASQIFTNESAAEGRNFDLS